MKEIKYGCDICKEYHKRPEAYDNMMACCFKSNVYFELTNINAECDTHICHSCLFQITEQYSKLKTKTS